MLFSIGCRKTGPMKQHGHIWEECLQLLKFLSISECSLGTSTGWFQKWKNYSKFQRLTSLLLIHHLEKTSKQKLSWSCKVWEETGSCWPPWQTFESHREKNKKQFRSLMNSKRSTKWDISFGNGENKWFNDLIQTLSSNSILLYSNFYSVFYLLYLIVSPIRS